METPQFNIQRYFTNNFGLGKKPAVNKLKLKAAPVVIALVCLVLTFAVHPACIIGTLLLGFYGAGLPLMNKMKEQKAADEWTEKYNYCRDNWDAEYDKFLKQVVDNINPKKKGMDRLGIDEDQVKEVEPFAIRGNDWKTNWRRGKDGIYRTNGYELSWLYFSDTQIYIYTVKFKLSEPTKLTEDTQEFFYTDIVSVAVNTESTTLSGSSGDGKDESINTEAFRLVVPGDKLSFAFTSNEFINTSVNGMKNLIRQKKMTK